MTTIFNTFEINLIMINSSTVNNKPVMGNPAFDDKNRYPWVAQSDTEDYIYIFSYAEITNIMNGKLETHVEEAYEFAHDNSLRKLGLALKKEYASLLKGDK